MSVSVSMPQLGESVTEGTVTRWLKHEGERVEADEPLLEVSTDKVDTEIPSPVSGILRDITVAEDETVAVGAELAVIDEEGSTAAAAAVATPAGAAQPAGEPSGAAQPAGEAQPPQAAAAQAGPGPAEAAQVDADRSGTGQSAADQAGAGTGQASPAQFADAAADGSPAAPAAAYQPSALQQVPGEPSAAQPPAGQPLPAQPPAAQAPAAPAPAAPAPAAPAPAPPAPGYQPPGYQGSPGYQAPGYQQPAYQPPAPVPPAGPAPSAPVPAAPPQGYYQPPAFPPAAAPPQPAAPADGQPGADAAGRADVTESPYVTPLVRKLAAEHGVDLAAISGTGVGGRIRKQDVLDLARARRDSGQPAAGPPGAGPAAAGPPGAAATVVPAAVDDAAPQQAERPAIVPSRLRGTTERMSRARQVIAQRMLESLQTSAQLTTVAEADVTAIARLRGRARAAFEAREGVKLSFLPFFALAAVEALKVHPKLNAFIDTASGLVTYHDAEHLGIAVDTERGLMVPVIQDAGDLNIAGLARKIADLAERTRAGRVSPDDLSGGTFTLTNTGSRGALFDTPIINQPQVAILGTGTVVKRAVVVDDPALGEVITVRSMVYLSLTYDHRLVDGADAARFLVTMKSRLEEGAFETELGL
jgi:pyruvate dehydrogenase E2 component (dihydrolipoamide acetyltransferase)